MKNRFQIPARILAFTAAAMFGATEQSKARAPEKTLNVQEKKILLKSAADCTAPEAKIDLDINNVRAQLMTAGNMWFDPGTSEARYEIPKGSRKNSLYAGALWIGGYDTQGNLKVTAQTYRSEGKNDYWSGPLDQNNNIDAATCNLWDRFWKVNASDVARFKELARQFQGDPQGLDNATSDPSFDVIKEWPAKGSVTAKGTNDQLITFLATTTRNYAPFVDVDGDGRYDYTKGDYPGETELQGIRGDQFIWRIYNDMGSQKTQTNTPGIGLEIQASGFAYSTKDYLNDASFYNYRLINRGNLTLDSCYTATWTDADLGFATDDYIGSDTARGLGILYNAKAIDGNGSPNHYGNEVPMVGVDFFIGPRKFFKDGQGNPIPDSKGNDSSRLLKMSNFTYFSNTGSGVPPSLTDPSTGLEFYRYMTGTNKFGQPFTNDFTGVCDVNTKGYGSGPNSTFVFTGDPGSRPSWSECCSNNPPGDRRFVHSAGPFQLTGGGVTNDITIGACWVPNVGGCPNTNFGRIKLADDAIQDLFDNDFRLIQGPEAPRVAVRELDRRVILYLSNDSNSNNFQEGFGTNLSDVRYRVSTFRTRTFGGADSLYKFEGYRIFQLKNSTNSAADIFGEDGRVNTAVAAEVFQVDIKNGIKDLVNHAIDNDIDGAIKSVKKVSGADQGIRHSFVISQDAFATGDDKKLVNYKTYYFVAIAYAYNNFANFDANNLKQTQDITYLESVKGQGGLPIAVTAVMPNPANTDMGTTINSDYGSGVKITRIEGTGNGGTGLQLTTASEDSAMRPDVNFVSHPQYVEGAGPINVKVADPVLLKEADWELSISGPLPQGNTSDGVDSLLQFGIRGATGTWKLTMRDSSTPVTIYSERNINVLNEQLLQNYGLSINIQQVSAPGDEKDASNGYISSDVTFSDPTQTWLTGVADGGVDGANFLNWIRSGSFGGGNDYDILVSNRDWIRGVGFGASYDQTKVYEKLISNNSGVQGTWAPYMLTANAARADSLQHALMPADINGPVTIPMANLPSVDVVFTADKSKWTRCVVVETSPTADLAEGGAPKFSLRAHKGWNKDDVDGNNNPVYNDSNGRSWFPGYAINQESGERLNIFFGEDSYLTDDNGGDMIWNPTTTTFSSFSPVFGGRHFVWVTGTRYDSCNDIYRRLRNGNAINRIAVYRTPVWCGIPMATKLLPLKDGLIPTTTRLRFRVSKPYRPYVAPGVDSVASNGGYPRYNFSTKGMGAKALTDAANKTDKQSLLDMITVVPNPYYAYAEGYEANRLDTRVRVTNLPHKAEISIYSIDGTMVRRLTKDNANQAYIDWDLRNAAGLPVASGMYLFHVKAEGIGETIIRFFGALRPLDIRNY